MPAITRIGDLTNGVCDLSLDCCPHNRTGSNGSHSPNVYANGKNIHRRGDIGATNCPHGGVFSSVGASSTVFVNGIPVTRIGDSTICNICGKTGNHSTGSPNVFVG